MTQPAQRQMLIQPKGIFRAKGANMCPDDFVVKCQDGLIIDGTIGKRYQIYNSYVSGFSPTNPNSFVFLGNALSSTKAYMVVVDNTILYGENASAISLDSLQTGRTACTYASMAVAYNLAYIFADSNAPRSWDFATGSTSALTTPPDEVCSDVVFHKGRLFAGRAATNKDYLYISQPLGSVFKTAWALRTPDNRTGFKLERIFSMGQQDLVVLTDLCPMILTGDGINNFSLQPSWYSPGMYRDMPKMACMGARGVYYLDINLELQRFEGNYSYNKSRATFGTFLQDDMLITYMSKGCMWADGRYIYISYPSIEISADATIPNRVLIFDENTETFVGEIRGHGIYHASSTYKKSMPKAQNLTRRINASIFCETSSLSLYPNKLYDASNRENITTITETKEYDPAPGYMKDFDRVLNVLDVDDTASNAVTVDVSIDSNWRSNAKSIALTATGPILGDELSTSATRVSQIYYPWILPKTNSSGTRMAVKWTHTGYPPTSDFKLNFALIDAYIPQLEEDKERAK